MGYFFCKLWMKSCGCSWEKASTKTLLLMNSLVECREEWSNSVAQTRQIYGSIEFRWTNQPVLLRVRALVKKSQELPNNLPSSWPTRTNRSHTWQYTACTCVSCSDLWPLLHFWPQCVAAIFGMVYFLSLEHLTFVMFTGLTLEEIPA